MKKTNIYMYTYSILVSSILLQNVTGVSGGKDSQGIAFHLMKFNNVTSNSRKDAVKSMNKILKINLIILELMIENLPDTEKNYFIGLIQKANEDLINGINGIKETIWYLHKSQLDYIDNVSDKLEFILDNIKKKLNSKDDKIQQQIELADMMFNIKNGFKEKKAIHRYSKVYDTHFSDTLNSSFVILFDREFLFSRLEIVHNKIICYILKSLINKLELEKGALTLTAKIINLINPDRSEEIELISESKRKIESTDIEKISRKILMNRELIIEYTKQNEKKTYTLSDKDKILYETIYDLISKYLESKREFKEKKYFDDGEELYYLVLKRNSVEFVVNEKIY